MVKGNENKRKVGNKRKCQEKFLISAVPHQGWYRRKGPRLSYMTPVISTGFPGARENRFQSLFTSISFAWPCNNHKKKKPTRIQQDTSEQKLNHYKTCVLLWIENSIVCTGKLSGVYRDPKGSAKRASFIFKCQSMPQLKKQSQKGLLKIPCVK